MSFSHFVSVATVQQWLQLGQADNGSRVAILDCRFDLMQPTWGAQAYAQGHIPGAVYVSLDDDLSAPKNGCNGRHPLPEPAVFAHTVGHLGIEADTTVVVYDQGALMMAARAWWMLRWLGHARVFVLSGGWPAWEASQLPVQVQAPSPSPARVYEPQVRSEMLVSVEEVLAQLGQGQRWLVDARAPERYRGDVEPLDRVAGHIPGAVNRPFTDNLEQGVLKPVTQLREAFAAVLGGTDSSQVVHSCGSGVSATANILAMEEAGLTGSRLYAGSWSEWSSDPHRPVEVGSAQC
ncbi:sulfurtransferase [Lampropedia puyangensis]|uniref:Sulfurtransferase n=1 Tax=Lampropedia puyangensis TaxID=1330072 RepID=A0A4S8EY87_9BURK|nr:sulfurtransferase [Lampropedia puyangensis]THT99897.1 sulfurtransferase [Lampropedia puyangensis]